MNFKTKICCFSVKKQFKGGYLLAKTMETDISEDANFGDLKAVFELCEPNSDGLISLRKLQELFQQHNPDQNAVRRFYQ